MVGGFRETPHHDGDNTDFPRPMRQSEERLGLARPPRARRNGAPYGRGAGGESDPHVLAAGAARGRAKEDRGRDTPCPPCRGRSHHSDPWREGHRAPFRAHGGCVCLRVALWPDCCSMCWCVSLCCTVYRFISASVPKPVNGSSASAPSGTSTSAPGCPPSSMRPRPRGRSRSHRRE